MPYGLPSMCASIQASSSWTRSALMRAMPSTPRPPAFETSTTTSRQCEKAKIGTSIPNISQRRLFMVCSHPWTNHPHW